MKNRYRGGVGGQKGILAGHSQFPPQVVPLTDGVCADY